MTVDRFASADAFRDFHTWKEHAAIFALSPLLVFHAFTAFRPTPIASPTATASAPVSTSASDTSASNRTIPSVSTTWSGRRFQNGLPSSTS